MSTVTSLPLLHTTIGKKAVMAVSGAVLFGFVVGHMLGNLQVYAGPERINDYARWLHDNAGLLWGARAVLLAAVVAHVASAISLIRISKQARPQRYRQADLLAATIASRTLRWGGLVIISFVVYHLLHLTWGVRGIHPQFVEGDVYCNVVMGLSVPTTALAYIIANIALGLHLYHGSWSMFQTLGLTNGRWSGRIRLTGAILVSLVVIANISFPVAALAGFLPSAGIC